MRSCQVDFEQKMEKKIGVQIEKTKINILQNKWGKAQFLLFKMEEKRYF